MIKFKKLICLFLTLMLMMSFMIPSFASEITEANETAKTPVKLTTEAALFSVTVPTGLPVNVLADGTINVADDAKIVNNSSGPVKVVGMTISSVDDWAIANYNTDLRNALVNSNQIGMIINNCQTTGANAITFNESNFNVMMAKNESDTDDECPIVYNANVSPLSEAFAADTVANVVFTIDWDFAPKPDPATMAANTTWYAGSTDKTTITEINIVDTYSETGKETESWSAAVDADGDGVNDNDIMCYVTGTELTIAGNGAGKIMANEDSENMFGGEWPDPEFSALTAINGLTLIDTSNVKHMGGMFANCINLESLDLSNFDTTKVVYMQQMFASCEKLTTLNLNHFDTDGVTNMYMMFYECKNLSTLNIDAWNMRTVNDISGMFSGCTSLTSLNVSQWNTASVENLYQTFMDCTGLTTLDLSGWNTSRVSNMGQTFRGCSNLTTIYASTAWSTARVSSSNMMFSGCNKLVGGAGTTYINTTAAYAHIDGGVDNPGYFTDIADKV